MKTKNYKTLLAGFIGGVAFVIGCGGGGGGGGSSTSNSLMNTAVASGQTGDIEEQYCAFYDRGSMRAIDDVINGTFEAGQTLKDSYPAATIKCVNMASESISTTTLDALYAAGWKTTSVVGASDARRYKVWRYVTN